MLVLRQINQARTGGISLSYVHVPFSSRHGCDSGAALENPRGRPNNSSGTDDS